MKCPVCGRFMKEIYATRQRVGENEIELMWFCESEHKGKGTYGVSYKLIGRQEWFGRTTPIIVGKRSDGR